MHLARVTGRLIAGQLMVDAWIPDASQGRTVGLVSSFVEPQVLLGAANTALQNLLGHDHVRSVGTLVSSSEVHQEYQTTNLIESIALGDSCLSLPFLHIQKNHQSSSLRHAKMCLSKEAMMPLSHLSLLLIGCTREYFDSALEQCEARGESEP